MHELPGYSRKKVWRCGTARHTHWVITTTTEWGHTNLLQRITFITFLDFHQRREYMSIWMSSIRSNVHSQTEEWMFCVEKTQWLPSGVRTSWCRYFFCLWVQHDNRIGSFTCQQCAWWWHGFLFTIVSIMQGIYIHTGWKLSICPSHIFLAWLLSKYATEIPRQRVVGQE